MGATKWPVEIHSTQVGKGRGREWGDDRIRQYRSEVDVAGFVRCRTDVGSIALVVDAARRIADWAGSVAAVPVLDLVGAAGFSVVSVGIADFAGTGVAAPCGCRVAMIDEGMADFRCEGTQTKADV